MGSRERRRMERRKRKRRSAQRAATAESPGEDSRGGRIDGGPAGDGTPAPNESLPDRMRRRAEQRDEAVRATLEPLEEGARPGAVTAGAVISALVATIFTVSAVVAAVTSAEVSGEEPSPIPLAVFGGVLWMMTWGMVKARYWAVLGFQMLLVLFMLSAAVGLVGAETVIQMVATLLLLLGAGLLFYFMIRAMARIQMPEPPGRE